MGVNIETLCKKSDQQQRNTKLCPGSSNACVCSRMFKTLLPVTFCNSLVCFFIANVPRQLCCYSRQLPACLFLCKRRAITGLKGWRLWCC